MTTRSTLKAVAFGAVAVVLGAAALPARAYEVEQGRTTARYTHVATNVVQSPKYPASDQGYRR